MKFSWAWNNCLRSSSLLAASSVIIGHEVSQLTLRANINLYNGIRNEIVLFNPTYLFLNYLKKGNFLKGLAAVDKNFFFTTSRSEFFFYVKNAAKICGATPIEFHKFMDLTKAFCNVNHNLNKEPTELLSKEDPIIFLFNNDNLGSRGIMREIKLKNYFTISIADSNSLNTGSGGYFSIYGNDDSLSAINFYCKFYQYCLKRNVLTPDALKKKKANFRPKKILAAENELHIIKKLMLKKNQL